VNLWKKSGFLLSGRGVTPPLLVVRPLKKKFFFMCVFPNMIINNYKRDEMNHSVVCDSLEGSEGEIAKRYPMDKAPSMAWYLMKK